jgi:hypothetical protein
MKAILVIIVILMGAHCGGPPPPLLLEPTDTDNCAAACARLVELSCPEGAPLEDGTTCTAFCEETQRSGHPLNPTCVMGLRECSAISECSAPRP